MNPPKENPRVYLNLQLPESEMDWLTNTLLNQLQKDEHLWTHLECELGPNAQPTTAFEKVTGRAKSAFVRILCNQVRADFLLEQLQTNRHPTGIRWQKQTLQNEGIL